VSVGFRLVLQQLISFVTVLTVIICLPVTSQSSLLRRRLLTTLWFA